MLVTAGICDLWNTVVIEQVSAVWYPGSGGTMGCIAWSKFSGLNYADFERKQWYYSLQIIKLPNGIFTRNLGWHT